MNYALLQNSDEKLQFYDVKTSTFVELPFTEDMALNPCGRGTLGAMDCCIKLPSGDGWLYGAFHKASDAFPGKLCPADTPNLPGKWCYTGEIGFISKDFSLVTPPIFYRAIPGTEAGYAAVRHPLLFRMQAEPTGEPHVPIDTAPEKVYCAFDGALFFLPMSWAAATPDLCVAVKDSGKHPPILLAGILGKTAGLYFGTGRATLSFEATHETLGSILSLSSDPFSGSHTASGLHTPSKYYYYCEKNFQLKDLKNWYCNQAFRYTGMAFLGDNHLAVQRDGCWGISTLDVTGFAEPAEFCFTAAPQLLEMPGNRRLRYLLAERFGLYGLLWIDSSNIVTEGLGYYWALPCEYDDIDYTVALSGATAADYLPIRKNGRWGLFGIDDFHDIALPCDYESVSLFWGEAPEGGEADRLCTVRRFGYEGVYNLTRQRWAVCLRPAGEDAALDRGQPL